MDIWDSAARLTFFAGNGLIACSVAAASDVTREKSMTFLAPFVRKLSVVTAYVAFAFVGAIVLGVI